MTATKSPGRPAPLRDADGNLIADLACSAGGLFFADGTAAPGDGSPDLVKMTAACRHRAYRLRDVPGTIGSAWFVPTNAPIPPPWLLQDMAEAVVAGEGILLLAEADGALNRACAFIEGAFAAMGVDTAADPISGHRQCQPWWRHL